MPEQRLQYLLEKFHAGDCSAEELRELENWYKELNATNKDFAEEGSSAAEGLKEEMLRQFRRRLGGQDKKVVRMPRRKILYRVVAAAAVIMVALITIFYFTGDKEKVLVKDKPGDGNQDVLPGGNHATLTLADGSSILLDTAKQGGLAQQGISAIHKPVDGLLVYERMPGSDGHDERSGMNLVRTPRGGQYQIQLPDGTKVWLNAASSIQFPVSFAASERRVTITGEVYFEVAAHVTASGAKQSFVIDVNGKGEVEVLGTHFNINAYDDEAIIKTTLLEGSVKVRNQSGESKTIVPGQQAQIEKNRLKIIDEADTEEAVAWKNGLFKFNDADIQAILRQAARWYDIEVAIKGTDKGERFRGKISRDVKLSEFLRILELNQVSFQLQGKKLIIQH